MTLWGFSCHSADTLLALLTLWWSHLAQWQPGGWTSGWLFVDIVLCVRMLCGSQPFYGDSFVQVCSVRLSRPTPSRSQIPKGLGSCILWLKLFVLNRMKQHNMIEREMTPKSGSWAQKAPLVIIITSCVGKVLNITSFKALLIVIMRSTVPISESCEYEMNRDYSSPLVNDSSPLNFKLLMKIIFKKI